MKLVFTKSKLPTGALITWGLEEPCSHFELSFFDSIILHSNFFGVHVNSKLDNDKWSNIVFEKEIKMSFESEAALLALIMQRYYGKGYDWKWFLSLCVAAFNKKFLRKEIKQEDIMWRSRDRFLCTEVIEFLKCYLKEFDSITAGNGSPYQLWLKVKDIRV